jgi:glucan-binding YG repeat protein
MSGVKFPAIKADVDLLKFYEGVDYSMFNEPITKFYYNKRKDNFDYDKEHLKAKMQAMKLVKEAEKKAIQLALQKNEAKQKELAKAAATEAAKAEGEKLAAEKKDLDEKLVKESLMLKLIEEDKHSIFNKDKEEVQLNIVAASNTETKQIIDKKINALVAKYKQGVTEERREGEGIIIITRILVREQEAWVYEKKIFNWGGVSYFRDKQRITASTFNMETATN